MVTNATVKRTSRFFCSAVESLGPRRYHRLRRMSTFEKKKQVSSKESEGDLELPSFRQHPEMSVKKTKEKLLEEAVNAKYGPRIKLRNTAITRYCLKLMWENFEVTSVDPKDHKPQEIARRIIDINTKEYVNWGSEADESSVNIFKSSGSERWTTANWTSGVEFGASANVGANVMGLTAMVPVGGSRFGGPVSKQKIYSKHFGKSSCDHDTFTIGYTQEEKISVPPRTKVTATITTYSVTHRMEYEVEFGCEAYNFIPVRYQTSLQSCFGGLCSKSGYITAAELLNSLPGFRRADGLVFFKQEGALSWVGGRAKVEKEETALP